LPACALRRLAGFLLFKSGRNGRGLACVYYGRGRRLPACLPACLAGRRAGRDREAGAVGLAVGPGGAARAACLPAVAIRRAEASTHATRHPVTGSKFQNRILDFVFNRKNPARKPFGLRENGQVDFGKPI